MGSGGGPQWFCFWRLGEGSDQGLTLCLHAVHAGSVGEVALSSQCPRPCWPQEAVWFCLPPGPQVSLASPSPLSMSPWVLGREGAPLVMESGGRVPTLRTLAGSDHILGSCRVCDEPSSEDPHEWPDDITKWPVSLGRRVGGESPCHVGEESALHLFVMPEGPDLCGITLFPDAMPLVFAQPVPPPVPAFLIRIEQENQAET